VAHIYFYFNEDDMEEIINKLKKINIELRPRFTRYRHVELVASNEKFFIGKYGKICFLLSDEEINIDYDFLKIVKIEISEPGETFYESRIGKYSVEEDGSLIKVEKEPEYEFLIDFIPAMYSGLIKSEIFVNECTLLASTVSKEETEIITEVTRLSEVAKKAEDVSELEEILSEVSTVQIDFFKKFMNFKDINEELFSSIMEYDVFARLLGGWFTEKVDELKDYFEKLKYFESKFEQTINGIRDLYTTVSLRLDMLRNREYLDLQRRTSSLQAAAVVIEFVAVYYYTMKIWEHFLPIEAVPGILSFLMLTSFTTSIVVYTEALSELIREKRITKGFVIVTFLLIIILFLMIYTPIIFSANVLPSTSH